MLPNFLIAGATRSGTTSLFNYVKQHPLISFSKLKEPRYFSSYDLKLPQSGPGDFSVDEKLITNFKNYKKLYQGINNKLVGDASSEYLYHYKSSVPEILKRLGDIPIIFVLRNPTDRAFSAYSNLVRDGRENLPFELAIEQERTRIFENYDMMWHYTEVSLYHKQISFFMKNFSRIKIIIFENFITNKNKTVNEVFDFLNIPLVKINTKTIHSKSGKHKFKIFNKIFGRNTKFGNFNRDIIFKIIGKENLDKLSSLLLQKNKVDIMARKKLDQMFLEDIKKLEDLTKINLDIWKQ